LQKKARVKSAWFAFFRLSCDDFGLHEVAKFVFATMKKLVAGFAAARVGAWGWKWNLRIAI
jgi:hypothetical protein